MENVAGVVDERKWNACVEALYDAVGGEDAMAAALGQFRQFVNARGVTFLTVPQQHGISSTHVAACDVHPASLVEYHSHYFQHDVWVQGALARTPVLHLGTTLRGSDVVSWPTLKQSYFFKDFLSRYDVGDVLFVVANEASQQEPPAVVTFHRGVAAGPYEARDVELAGRLAPHVHRVLKLHRRFAPTVALGSTLLEIFRAADTPMLLLGKAGEVVDRNSAATAFLSAPHPPLRLRGKLLQVKDPRGKWADLSLGPSVADTDPVIASATVHRVSGAAVASVEIRPVHGASASRLADFPVHFICTVRPFVEDTAANMRNRFGFTAAEAEVAIALMAGNQVKRIAAMQRVAVSTVRTHMSALFSKTRTRRQVELIALLNKARSY